MAMIKSGKWVGILTNIYERVYFRERINDATEPL